MANIDGQRLGLGSAEREFYKSKLRLCQFLEDRMTDPNSTKPLVLINWETYYPDVHVMLKKWGMLDISN